ncbi:hypothetical protein V8G54_002395 [Vigna mungo]|uniref:Uncharacterized protein n=1 Tax=Vigna mungo TaxID=3915 RepID=A0AAQ3SCH7_VIGMU
MMVITPLETSAAKPHTTASSLPRLVDPCLPVLSTTPRVVLPLPPPLPLPLPPLPYIFPPSLVLPPPLLPPLSTSKISMSSWRGYVLACKHRFNVQIYKNIFIYYIYRENS